MAYSLTHNSEVTIHENLSTVLRALPENYGGWTRDQIMEGLTGEDHCFITGEDVWYLAGMTPQVQAPSNPEDYTDEETFTVELVDAETGEELTTPLMSYSAATAFYFRSIDDKAFTRVTLREGDYIQAISQREV